MGNDENRENLEQKIKKLQLLYAAALADAVYYYGSEGVLEKVTKHKKNNQLENCKTLAARFEMTEPKHAFEKTRDMYGCADWICQDTDTGFTAIAKRCMLCSISQSMGNFCPCQIFCLSPIEAALNGIVPDSEFNIISTLWNSGECKVKIILRGLNEGN